MLIVMQTSHIEWATKMDATIIIILIAVVSLDNSFRYEESQPCADFRLWHNFVKSRGNNSVSIPRLLSFTLTTREALSPCVSFLFELSCTYPLLVNFTALSIRLDMTCINLILFAQTFTFSPDSYNIFRLLLSFVAISNQSLCRKVLDQFQYMIIKSGNI